MTVVLSSHVATSSSCPAVKTPAKPFQFTAENSTAKKSGNTKRNFDLQASLKRARPNYKTYTGQLYIANLYALSMFISCFTIMCSKTPHLGGGEDWLIKLSAS